MAAKRFQGIAACVFDAYGTLFDVGAPARRLEQGLGGAATAVSELWRSKQLQYTWLRSLMGRHADFWRVTGDALDYALVAHGIRDARLRGRLMREYLTLDAYPDARHALARLKGAGIKCAILSNGSPRMLRAVVKHSGLAHFFDAVLSVEEVGIYKPHPKVYRLAVARLKVPAARVAFQTANAWDAAGAKAFGFRVAWINRAGGRLERLPGKPDAELASLAELPALIGIERARTP